MSVRNYQLGSLNPVVYFVNSSGVISLPTSTEHALSVRDRMRKRGFELREAGTLAEIDNLQRHMQDQEYRTQQQRLEVEEGMGARVRASVRDRLYQRMISAGSSAYEKEFIKNYLMLRDEKRETYQKRFMADNCYFEAREFDANSRHMQDVADRVPDGKDTECTRCHAARRIKDSNMCFTCTNAENNRVRR